MIIQEVNTIIIITYYLIINYLLGIFEVWTNSEKDNVDKETIIAFLDQQKGSLRLKSYKNDTLFSFSCCQSAVACIAFNSEGTILATTSEKGTLIRIYQVSNGTFLHEIRRGSQNAEIGHISFDDSSYYVSCTSNHGTIHLFSLFSIKDKIKPLLKGNE